MIPEGSRPIRKYRENLGQVPAWGFIGVWLVPECIDVAVCFREWDRRFRGTTVRGSLILYPAEGCACTDWITGLKAIRNKRGERVPPWNTPLFTGKEGGCQTLVTTCAESEEYRFWTYWVIGVGRLMYSSMSWMYWWVIEPKAFRRSMKVRAIGSEFHGALSRMDWTAKMYSIQPLMPWRKPFWRDVSMMLFATMYLSRQIAMILWNSLAITEDRSFLDCGGP